MIEVKNLTKSFEDKTVLNDISATFEQGKTNLIIGASGSGKSVMLKNIVGLFKPDSGEILYNGRDFINANRDLKTEIRREIGMLFQGGALFDSMNVEQNVKFPLDVLTTMPEDEKLDRVNTVLKRVKLENTNKRMPSEISGGMQKRVGIARAIVNSSKYLFCDEPNSGLDPQTSIKIDQLLAEITDEYQITTVVVTHDMNSVMEIGEYIVFIGNTKKLWEGNSDDIMHSGVQELDDFVFANKMMRKFRSLS
ncbi:MULTISPECIES: ATP-binding cassette domain-containing protein [Roseivirga]|jgi:phospholipid/cholesterol/gamma-HCH transport system ATP-binding protein|uniref:Phosphonate ABC transporter ATP-binding protein n=1 Tax=Roseivirga thermotolerans TaxID=1758176 RepID=A0ABQ3I9M9_9BACT|nr:MULTISPECIES: ATP-binding cassette domain-containing protein [Roseivirga]MEC7752400.1 ATP-binding cassette domain-containing protein [Bacteroidota bacterium]GHE67925.1 phosphonate ABC transporter ATP-binding protein [Roseivirga thermotolerans]|tara:strand:- start:24775 stop:25527 length:753 start_codon:yes stop_codon:yes gene_type:complete